MSGHWWGRSLAVLGLLVGAGVIAAFAYHADTLDSGSMAVQAAAMHAGGGPGNMMYGAYGRGVFWHGGGFFAGFFLLRILFAVFVLFLLLRQPGRIFTRAQLLDAVHGVAFESYERAIDTHVKNLRRKLEPEPRRPRLILTVYGVGYRFAAD